MNHMTRTMVLQQVAQGDREFKWIPPTIQELSNLSGWGRLSLSLFEDEVISTGIKNARPHNNINSLIKFCVNHYQTHNIKIEWKWLYDLGRHLSIPPDSSRTLDGTPGLYKSGANGFLYTIGRRDPEKKELKEIRNGISELTKLAVSIKIDDLKPISNLLGGKHEVFNLWSRMSYHWDTDVTSTDVQRVYKSYIDWQHSPYGKTFYEFFGKFIPFWLDSVE